MSTTTLRPEERSPFVPIANPGFDPAFDAGCDPDATLEVRTDFQGMMIGSHLVCDPPTKGPGRFVHGLARRATFVVGRSAKVDAPAASDLLGSDDLPLVSKWAGGFLVQVTPHMTGTVEVDGKVFHLGDYLKGRGSNFTLPASARARIDCGAMSFHLEHTRRAPSLPRPWFKWRWAEQKFTLASFLGLGLFLLMSFVLPPEGATVSNELLGIDRKILPLLITPPQPAKVPEAMVERADKTGGESGEAHIGNAGRAGDKNTKRRAGAVAIRGDGKDMHLGKAEAAAEVLNRGILGILRSTQSAQFADIFGRGSAVGNAKETVLGNLASNDLDNAYGAGGFTVVGTGNSGGGTNLRTFGIGRYNTLGGTGYGGGPAIGSLRTHITRPPMVTTGVLEIKGSLDKEIIRRVVHLHMKEVKYCYDKELGRKASLAGRISVSFVISPFGQVISSVLQSTTMNDLGVESCVIGAIKRWEFPKPRGGGIAIVSYPFNFVSGS